jgi:hypothetical protein
LKARERRKRIKEKIKIGGLKMERRGRDNLNLSRNGGLM